MHAFIDLRKVRLAIAWILLGSWNGIAQIPVPPDPSIGSNLPGTIPQRAPDAFERERPKLEEDIEPPEIPSIGLPGSGILRRLVFVGALDAAPDVEGSSLLGGIFSHQVDLLEKRQRLARELDQMYMGKPFNEETVREINQKILNFYFRNERPLVFVQPTFVDYKKGIMRFLVIEARLGEKTATGAKWFSNNLLLSNIRAKPGQTINRMRLLNDVAWINDNPFLSSNVTLKPGTQPGTTNIVLETRDRFPVRVFAAADNTGSQQTGAWRWTVGANWGNAFFLGHQLNYQFSAAFQNIYAQPVHALSYIAPLPWRHELAIYSSYAYTNTSIGVGGGESVEYSGYQSQVSPRYTIPIGKQYGRFQHEVTFGMDWKSSDLSFLQGGETIPSNQTAVWQFMGGYNAELADDWGRTTLALEGYFSPGGIGGNNTDAAFQEVDPRLEANYFYGIIQLGRMTRLPWDFSLVTDFTGQFASSSLLSSEQLAIGGYGTVRGYEERILFGDQGIVWNLELRTPTFPFLSWLWKKFPKDQMQFLGFWDLGLVNTIDPLPGDQATYYITSVGAGVRYNIATNLSIRCDVGFPLVNPNIGVSISPRAAVGVVMGF